MDSVRNAVTFAGLPGRGKTTLAEQLAADVTCRRLEGHLFGQPAHVLMISYEDAIAETLVPRLIAAEADLDRVEFVACRDVGQVLDITRHLPDIERRAAECKARLLVIDPLVAGFAAARSEQLPRPRRALGPGPAGGARGTARPSCTEHHAFLKERSECTLRCWRQHRLCRCRALNPGLRARSAGQQGAAGPKRILAHAKCNVGRLQKSRELSLTEFVIDPFETAITTSTVVIGEQCDVAADDLVKDVEHKVSARAEAKRFLRELLIDGPHRATEVYALADDADISRNTLNRAKKDMGIDSFQRKTEEGKPEWWWVLPEEEEPPPTLFETEEDEE